MKIFNKQPNEVQTQYKTERQWNLAGYILKPKARGKDFWTNGMCQRSATYYASPQVIKDEDKASSIIREIKRKQAKESRLRAKYRKQKEAEDAAWHAEHDHEALKFRELTGTEYQWREQGRKPNEDAKWIPGEVLNSKYRLWLWGKDYWYCHKDDTHPIETTQDV